MLTLSNDQEGRYIDMKKTPFVTKEQLEEMIKNEIKKRNNDL